MNSLDAWLRGPAATLPYAVRAALAHLEIVAIHPFDDGNGRTAREFARRLLARAGRRLGRLPLERLFGELDRNRYCAAIEAALGRGYRPGYDATPFVIYFLATVIRALERDSAGRVIPRSVALH